jgi:hypothetical protein
VDHHVKINRETYPHIVYRLAGLAQRIAVAARVYIRFGVDEMRFDVPQAVVAFIALAFDGAFVDGFAGRG